MGSVLYWLMGVNACENWVLIKQEDYDGGFQQAIVLGKSGSLQRLCAGRRVQVQKYWLSP